MVRERGRERWGIERRTESFLVLVFTGRGVGERHKDDENFIFNYWCSKSPCLYVKCERKKTLVSLRR